MTTNLLNIFKCFRSPRIEDNCDQQWVGDHWDLQRYATEFSYIGWRDGKSHNRSPIRSSFSVDLSFVMIKTDLNHIINNYCFLGFYDKYMAYILRYTFGVERRWIGFYISVSPSLLVMTDPFLWMITSRIVLLGRAMNSIHFTDCPQIEPQLGVHTYEEVIHSRVFAPKNWRQRYHCFKQNVPQIQFRVLQMNECKNFLQTID